MKTKITMLFALVIVATTSSYAQNRQRMSTPERVKTTMDKITKSLELNASQVSSTDSVFTEYYTEQMKMFTDARSSGERPDRSAFEKLTEKRNTKLKAIFTADQFKKFEKEEAEARQQMMQRRRSS